MLTEVPNARRESASSWESELQGPLGLNEDTLWRPFYTVTTAIPQDLNPAYLWVMFPCFTVLVATVRPTLRKNGLAAVVHDQDVDGVDTGGGVPRKYGWGGSLPNDPQSNPTPLPSRVDGPVEFYYEPGWLWQYFFAGPIQFRLRGGFVEAEGPPTSTYTVALDDRPFDWRGPIVQAGDQFTAGSAFVYVDDHFFMTPGAPNFPRELVMTFTFPYEFAGATWTVQCSEVVYVPFGTDESESTVIAGPGLTGIRPRGQIVGQIAPRLTIG